MVNFPTSLDSLANPTSSTKMNDTGYKGHEVIGAIHDILEALEAKLGIGATTPARGKTLLGAASGSAWDGVSRKNLLIGGSAQLWELGTSPTATDNAYIGGNWRVLMEAANACTVTRETTDLPTGGARAAWKVIAGSGNNNKFGLFQAIEGADIWHLRGAVASLRLAAKLGGTLTPLKAAILTWVGTEDATTVDPISSWGAAGTNPTLAANWAYVGTPVSIGATTSWQNLFPTENGSITASATNLAVFIWSDDKTTTQTTDYFLVTDVQVEAGAVCTAIDRRKVTEEQLLDLRYAARSYEYGTANAAATSVGAHYILASDNVTAKFTTAPVYYSVPMRAVPALSFWDGAGNASRITTMTAGGAETNNVTPSIGLAAQTTKSFRLLHSGAVAGSFFHWFANSRI